MRYIHRIALRCVTALSMIMFMACEGSEKYEVGAPDWLQDKINEAAANSGQDDDAIDYIPTPDKLGENDNSTGFWKVFTNDQKIERGEKYKVVFTNFGGASNWNNFLVVLRNGTPSGEEGYYEYGILRADNWCWNTSYPEGGDSDNWCTKMMEGDRDDAGWAAFREAMTKARCTAYISNKGDGTADVEITMLGADGKTYRQSYLGIKVSNPDDLYFCFTVDGSHLVFGDVDETDQEPVSMVLNNIPKKVLQNVDFDELMAAVTATVTFADGSTKTVKAEELQMQTVPNTKSLGTKAVVAVYNKTYQGNAAATAVVATAEFEVVDKMYTIIGTADNSCGFREYKTENFKVGPGETYINYFTNYTNGAANWNNFIVTLCKADNSEYCFVRADNWGTGVSYWDGCQSCDWNWDTFTTALNGAKVTTYITNNGDGTADVTAVVLGSDGNTYTQKYTGLKDIDPNDFYFYLSTEKGHLELDKVIGAEDNTSAFRAESNETVKVPAGRTYVNRFVNYTDGAANWNNFIITLSKGDNTEYCFVRADNWGTGVSYWDGCQSCDWNWDTFTTALDGAVVTTYITNNGDGTANVRAVVLGSDGNTYTQNYTGLNNIDPDDFCYTLSMERAHLVFE